MTADLMSSTTEAARERADAITAALDARAREVHDAEVEYSESLHKLQERFAADTADALARYRAAVLPAHRAANVALIEAERRYPRPR